MNILGISDSHEAHACIVQDGEILAAVAEERFSRVKSDMGYPKKAIENVLEITKLDPKDIDLVAFAGEKGDILDRIFRPNAYMKVKDWIEQSYKYWGPILLEGKSLSPVDNYNLFKHLRGDDIYRDPYYSYIKKDIFLAVDNKSELLRKARIETVHQHLKINTEKIRFFRHEDCHKAYGLLSSPNDLEEAIVLTLEGGGDDSSATFSIFKNDEITEIWKSNSVNLGRLYRYVTLILGMLPSQHEYKVMGLAPYGNEYHGNKSKKFFDSLSEVKGTEIINTNKVKDLYFSVKESLEGERFDGIAWGLQTHLEEVLCQWVENCIKETNIKNVIISGGVGQNIKACKTLIDKTSLKYLWAGPICGDGSLGIGAAWLATLDKKNSKKIKGYKTIYLGKSYSDDEVEEAVSRNRLKEKYHIIENPNIKTIASWINKGNICARFSERMEFGQRALGNRSIIADPRKWESVERVNKKIKYRDFWMPFTPSMTFEQANKIIINPKNIYSPFMTMAFDINDDYIKSIPAAIHPSDKTVRPQMLKYEDNPKYYKLLQAFGELSGLECLMNTSFNLHGEAIVENPEQAISTFIRSELDILLFDKIAISREPL
ncbi:carbamoyltransferase [Alphaproteobacteria bacterium]|nr:carbamoyltransferase [Alphaproteobacteria bacterium]